MKRVSYYISQQASEELDAAVAQVVDALGDVPKHVALSALILAAAAAVPQVSATLAEARANELAEQLDRLRRPTT
jgi:hypothetical protein